MIKSELKKVRGLLDDSVKYIVPDYQRNFEWKKDQAEEFWTDVSTGSVFLGNLVLDVHNESNNEVMIVDGQQRITTIFIFLAACRNQAKKNNSHEQAAVIQKKISFVDDTRGNATASKLLPSPSIKKIFEDTISNPDWDGKTFEKKCRGTNKIKVIYDYFSERIISFGEDDLADLLQKLYESTFVKIDIEEQQEAFEIFERTNARGMELNAADLLKNYLFAKNASDKLTEDWDEIVSGSSGNILRMIKYFYVSRKGPVLKKELFRALKKLGESVGPDNLLNDVKSFAFYYGLVTEATFSSVSEWAIQMNNTFFSKEYNAKALARSLNALQLFGVTQVYPLLIKLMQYLAVAQDFNKNEKISNKFLDFVVSIEKFHFLNYAVAQRPGNQVEIFYADQCKTDFSVLKPESLMTDIINELKNNKLVSRNEFLDRFMELNYQNDSHLVYYIFDRLNNHGRKGGQYIEIFNPDKKILAKNYDIDHLISQNLDNYSFDLSDIGDQIHAIGNLLVISKHTNGKCQNIPIDEKILVFEQLEIFNLPEARILINDWGNKSWSKITDVSENITARGKSIAARCFDEVWKI